MTTDNNPLARLESVEAEIRALRARAERNNDHHAVAQCARQLAECDQIRARITEAGRDAEACAALENQFDAEPE